MERSNDMKFNEKQIELVQRIGVSVNSFDSLTDEEIEQIEEKVSEHLQKHGFDKDYKPTEEGKICESILDEL